MIEVHDLVKRYGTVDAVKGVSFSLGQEEVLGFLGPNGAGKTTIMKILTGYHFPTFGTAQVNGISVEDEPEKVKSLIGYLPEAVPLYYDLTVEEYLDFVAQSRLIPRGERKKRLNYALDACGLGPLRKRKIEQLSKGYKQRTGLAQAIIHDPPILILDEPTTGLDPNQIIEIRGLIQALGKSKTVILSTHILQEVEAVCNRVLILNEGRIAAAGTASEIALAIKGGETWAVTLKAAGEGAVQKALEKLASKLGGIEKEALTLSPEGSFDLSFCIQGQNEANADAPSSAELIFDWAVKSKFKILKMDKKRLSLEEIFVKLTHSKEDAQ
ncbi:MAG: ATP-binding cassette domain-containing protein [Treponema sp.]|jgi:ABC-2 type transport system ATP-binding protein|nr:ATP-binding cassette domain-containing protein [Treponema sp.]